MKNCRLKETYRQAMENQRHISIMKSAKDYTLFRVAGEEGDGTVEVWNLFPGIQLSFHDFRCSSFSINGLSADAKTDVSSGLKLNYCLEGRMEVKMSDEKYLFLEHGMLGAETRIPDQKFSFPLGRYKGAELFVHNSALAEISSSMFDALHISVHSLSNHLCKNETSYICKENERIRRLFEDIFHAPEVKKINYLQIKAVELLFVLNHMELPDQDTKFTYFTAAQVEIAKQLKLRINQDIGRNVDMKELALSYGISVSSLRNYFKGIYEVNPAEYVRRKRMEAAAVRLKETRKSVADIALSVGYGNPSKFAAVFRQQYKAGPLEYRSKTQLKNEGGIKI